MRWVGPTWQKESPFLPTENAIAEASHCIFQISSVTGIQDTSHTMKFIYCWYNENSHGCTKAPQRTRSQTIFRFISTNIRRVGVRKFKCKFTSSSSSTVGATARCGLWPVEQYLSIFPIYHQLSPSSHSQHLKISFYFFSPSLPGSSSSFVPSNSWVKIFLGILSSSILSRWPSQLILCPFIHFSIFSPSLNSSSSRFVLLFHSPFSYLGPYSSKYFPSENYRLLSRNRNILNIPHSPVVFIL